MDELREKLDWFKNCILPHQSALHSKMRSLTRNSGEVEDLVSEVLARAYANSGWRNVTHGRAYLFTIARNLAIDLARRNKIVSFETITEIELLQSGSDLDTQLCARDQLRRLHQIMNGLPTQCRRVFVARRVHEKSLAEIAVEMDLSVSTVEKHLAKAIRLFAKAIAEQEEAAFERVDSGQVRRDRATGC